MPALKEKKQNELGNLPKDIEAEEAVLGAILVSAEVLVKVVELLKPEYFFKIAHRYIYEAMLELFNSNEKIDIVSVSDVLNTNMKLEQVGGRAFINDLCYKTVTTSNVAYYAKIIQEKAIKRSLINAGSEIVSLGYDVNPVGESLDSAQKVIYDVAAQKTMNDLVPVKKLVFDTYDKIEYRYNHKDELLGVRTNFFDIDVMTNGLQKSDLIIIAARPSMGKTTFALNIAQNVAIKEKTPVAIFSLEMSKEQLMQRMLCSEAEVDTQRLNTGNMQQKDWEKIANAMNSFAQAPIYVDDTSGCTLTDIRAKCRKLKLAEPKLGLVVIDYMQLMEGSGKEDRMQQISAISRGLKTLARELDLPVIALSQLSRSPEARTDKRPMLSDLRESGAIEQDADIVIFIYRDEYYKKIDNEEEEMTKAVSKGESEIIIAKHRNGPVGTVKLLFQGNITKFKNPIKTDVF